MPRWLLVADRSTPWRAFAIGAVLVLANPKNLALTVAAAGAIAGTGAGAVAELTAVLLFAVLGTAGLAVPLTLRISMGCPGRRAADALAPVAGAARDPDRLRRAGGDRRAAGAARSRRLTRPVSGHLILVG